MKTIIRICRFVFLLVLSVIISCNSVEYVPIEAGIVEFRDAYVDAFNNNDVTLLKSWIFPSEKDTPQVLRNLAKEVVTYGMGDLQIYTVQVVEINDYLGDEYPKIGQTISEAKEYVNYPDPVYIFILKMRNDICQSERTIPVGIVDGYWRICGFNKRNDT